MAAAPKKQDAAGPNPVVEAEVKRRLADARTEKQQFLPLFQDAWRFVMPWRVMPGLATSTPANTSKDLFTSVGIIAASDFSAMIADTYMPEHSPWASQEATAAVPEDAKEDFDEFLKKDAQITFAAISASAFYTETKRLGNELAVSAGGVIIEDRGGFAPIHCQLVPLTELLISRGNDGGIDFRAWEQPKVSYADCVAIFGEKKIPAKVREKKNKTGAKICKVQGCYRDYSVRGELAWITFSALDDILIESSRKVGEGSASLLVARWDPDPCFSWGIGCAIKAVADLNESDEVRYLMLKGLARTIDPSFAYDDDSVINPDGGVANGTWVPRMKGSKIDPIESARPIDVGYFAARDVEHTVRRHFYVDEPEQQGKTPPTLGQWADESMRTQRRLGAPASLLWPEFISEAFQRFRFLLKERGQLEDFKVKDKVIQLQPINPLKRAASQDKAIATERFYNALVNTFGPDAPELVSNVGATIHSIHELSGADGADLKSIEDIDAAFAERAKQRMMAGAAEMAGKAGLAPAIAGLPGQ